MSDLAYDMNGNPIRPKPEARKWLVKKIRPKAPPQVMFRNGSRVTLPINGSPHHLREMVNEPGRFRLVALDEFDEPVEGMPEAYVELDAEPPPPPAAFIAPPPDPLAPTRAALSSSPTELLLLETVRANTDLARATIDRIPDILRASAYLLQTADGAGLPRRPPMRFDDLDDQVDDDFDDDEPAPAQPPSLLNTFLSAALASGGGLPGIAKMLGAGGLAGLPTQPTATSSSTAPATPAADIVPPTAPRNAAPAQPVDTQAHLFSILAQLTADERAYAERVFAQLSPEAVRQWHELLLSMSVDDAVNMIRAKAAGQET